MPVKIIKYFVFCVNILLLFVVDVALWTISICSGIGGIIGIAGFFVGYSISGGMTIAPRDYWRFPEFTVFKKKLAYANMIAIVTSLLATYIVAGLYGIIHG